MSRRLLVFCWHNMDPTPAFPAEPGAGRRGFAQQIRLLSRITNVVPLANALEDLHRGKPLPSRAVSLTFDDGYRDNLDVAVPILQRFGLPATFFLTPGFLNGDVEPWWESLAVSFRQRTRDSVSIDGRSEQLTGPMVPPSILDHLKSVTASQRSDLIGELRLQLRPAGQEPQRELLLDWEGAAALADRGFSIGAHSMTHPILARETADVQQYEIGESRAALQARLDQPIELFAYPNGRAQDYDKRSISAACASGYAGAVTTTTGWNRTQTSPYEVRRVVVSAEHGRLGLAQEARWWLSARIRHAGTGATAAR